MVNSVIVKGRQVDRKSEAGGWEGGLRPTAIMSFVAGITLLLASLFDYGILWITQRQEAIQWEFVAVTRTVEGFDNLIVATAMIYIGLYLYDKLGVWMNRILSTWVIVMGLACLGLLALGVLNYLGLRGQVNPQAAEIFRASMLKTGMLSLLYAVFLLPAGVLGFRLRKS